MKKINFLSLVFTLLLTVLAFSNVLAQEPVTDETQNPRRAVRPFKIMQELGLSREQIQQIRQINQTRRPIMQEAQRRWRSAQRDLDLAVYADDSTEEQVKELTKTAQLAQAELLKARTLTEYLIRKVLTPEQLVKFRNLRQQLIEERLNDRKNLNLPDNPNNIQQRPPNRFQQRRNQDRQ
jgi:Spy/CpxP family protein refolding chaperone